VGKNKSVQKPSTPQISVVITTFNYWPLLACAVRSALAQTHPPFEVIVVDDGSTDGTEDGLRSEFGQTIEYHRQANAGPSAARNTGVELSRGEWVAFLDADDQWDREKLAKQAACISSPEIALVACEALIRDQSGHVLSRRLLPQPFNRSTVTRELTVRTASPMGVLVKRDIFLQLGGFSRELMCGEDREMWARIVAHFDIAAVHEPLLLVTDHGGSVSHNAERVLSDGLLVNRRVQKLLRSGSVLRDTLTLRKSDSQIYWSAAWLSAGSRNPGRAAREVLHSIWLDPFSRPKAKLGLLYKILLGKAV
jgi:glycosyltransferase involved in cell wall biosynthesis